MIAVEGPILWMSTTFCARRLPTNEMPTTRSRKVKSSSYMFIRIKLKWKTAAISFTTFVCPHVTTLQPLKKFSRNLKLGEFYQIVKTFQFGYIKKKTLTHFTWRSTCFCKQLKCNSLNIYQSKKNKNKNVL